jgi:hypothetical protein
MALINCFHLTALTPVGVILSRVWVSMVGIVVLQPISLQIFFFSAAPCLHLVNLCIDPRFFQTQVVTHLLAAESIIPRWRWAWCATIVDGRGGYLADIIGMPNTDSKWQRALWIPMDHGVPIAIIVVVDSSPSWIF